MRHEILVFELDDLDAGPYEIVSLPSEVIGMHLLQDGRLLVGRDRGFSFVNQQCTE